MLESARNAAEKLKTLKEEFKTHQLAIIDLTDDEDDLDEEQQALDDYEDSISELDVRIQRLMKSASNPDKIGVATKQLTLLSAKLTYIEASVHDVDDSEDDSKCVLEEYRAQLVDIKDELSELKMNLLKSEATPDDPVMQEQARTEKAVFDNLLLIKKRLCSSTASPTTASEATVTKLPKLELPAFHGDMLLWRNIFVFWCTIEQVFPRKRSLCTCRMPSRTRQPKI